MATLVYEDTFGILSCIFFSNARKKMILAKLQTYKELSNSRQFHWLFYMDGWQHFKWMLVSANHMACIFYYWPNVPMKTYILLHCCNACDQSKLRIYAICYSILFSAHLPSLRQKLTLIWTVNSRWYNKHPTPNFLEEWQKYAYYIIHILYFFGSFKKLNSTWYCYTLGFFWFDLILYIPSTIFQL